ncbi:MAG: hypothetical protein ACLRX4_04105 [Oscillospiraceae bacterium]
MHNENKVPLIRLAKRDMMEPWKVWCIRLASIVLALLLGGLVMMIALPDGATPIDGYATIITGALGKKTAIRQTVKLAVPLLGCALAIAPCFKMRFWNIGAEGQITAGAIAASYFLPSTGSARSRPLSCSSSWVWRALSPAASGR